MRRAGDIPTLLVDDDEDVRLLMRMSLESADHGLRVAGEASDGMSALEQIDELDPAVIVLDQMMPFMNGLETAARILERRPDQRIVLVSGYLDDWLRDRALEAGIAACLDKRDIQSLPSVLIEVVERPSPT